MLKIVINKKLITDIKSLKKIKMLLIRQIVKITEKNRTIIYKVLKRQLGYVSNQLVLLNLIGFIVTYFDTKIYIYLLLLFLVQRKMNQNNL